MKVYSALMVSALVPLLGGCGMMDPFSRIESDGYTTVKFSGPSQDFSALGQLEEPLLTRATQMAGGIYVYVHALGGAGFSGNFLLSDESVTQSVSIPNGVYKVYAFGYATEPFTGTVKCGFGDDKGAITLNGGAKTIGITLSAANCASTEFGPAEFLSGNQFFPLVIETCGSNEGAMVVMPDYTCTSGTLGSVRVEMPLYSATGPAYQESLAPPMKSTCLTFASHEIVTSLKIPLGSESADVPKMNVKITGYSDAACTVEPRVFNFPNGLISPSFSSAMMVRGTSVTKLFLMDAAI